MPQSNIEVFYTIWFAVPSEEAQNHGVLCLHGLAGNLGQWSQQCAGRSQHTDERPKDPMMLAEIYVNFASDLWTRPSTSEEMLRVGQNGLSTCPSTLAAPSADSRCLWSQVILLFCLVDLFWSTSRVRSTTPWTRSPLMAMLGLPPSKRGVPDWFSPSWWWLEPTLEFWLDDWWHHLQLHLWPSCRHHQPWWLPCSHSTSTSRIHLQHSGQSHRPLPSRQCSSTFTTTSPRSWWRSQCCLQACDQQASKDHGHAPAHPTNLQEENCWPNPSLLWQGSQAILGGLCWTKKLEQGHDEPWLWGHHLRLHHWLELWESPSPPWVLQTTSKGLPGLCLVCPTVHSVEPSSEPDLSHWRTTLCPAVW